MTILDALFGCWHKRTTFPLTSRRGQRRSGASQKGTYIVCLDCGKELPFGWYEVDIISHEVPRYEAMAVFASSVAES